MMSEQQARNLKLPGSDTFMYSQLAYKNSSLRDGCVVSLLEEAYRAFILTSLIGNYRALKRSKEMDNLRFTTYDLPVIPPPLYMAKLENINLENLLISTGFEISIKAHFLKNDFVLQYIDENNFPDLAGKQAKQPIHKDDLLLESGYYYDRALRRNYLRGLKLETIKYSILLKSEYKKVIDLSDDAIGFANEYRKLRNQIHFPLDVVDMSALHKYAGDNVEKFIVEYINSEVVGFANTLIEQNKFNNTPLERLTYFD